MEKFNTVNNKKRYLHIVVNALRKVNEVLCHKWIWESNFEEGGWESSSVQIISQLKIQKMRMSQPC